MSTDTATSANSNSDSPPEVLQRYQAAQESDDGAKEFREWLASMPRSERVKHLFCYEPTDYQADLLDHGEEVDKAQLAPKKGRQVGATLTAAVLGADRAVMHNDDILFAAPGQSTADELFRVCKEHFHNSLLPLDAFGVTPKMGGKNNERTWEFDSGHRILSRTLGNVNRSDQAGNRGLNPPGIIIDEAAYGQDQVYTDEVEGFLITHSEYEFLLLSTPAGKSGYFYEAVEGRNADDWYSPHWPTHISPYAEEDYIERKRRELDSQTFAQEYLGEFAESESAYLPHDIVKPCVFSNTPETRNNALRYLGVDPARSGDDSMVIYDLDEFGVTRNIWAEQTTTGTGFVGHIQALQEGHANTDPVWGDGSLPPSGYQSIAIEENSVGGFGADLLESRVGDVIQMVTTGSKSKQAMYQRLKKDLEDENLSLPNHRRLISQLTALEYEYTEHGYLKVSHPQGGHDDFPDALALCNSVRNNLDIVSNPQRGYTPDYFRIDMSS